MSTGVSGESAPTCWSAPLRLIHRTSPLHITKAHHLYAAARILAGWLAAEGQGSPELGSTSAAAAEAAAAANLCWLEDCIVRIICVLALDRFADFVSDQASYCSAWHVQYCRRLRCVIQVRNLHGDEVDVFRGTLSARSSDKGDAPAPDVSPWKRSGDAVLCGGRSGGRGQAVAPVRDVAAQALGAAVQPVPPPVLLALVRQVGILAGHHQWEVRHSGLLALKYIVAARPDATELLLAPVLAIAQEGLQVKPA